MDCQKYLEISHIGPDISGSVIPMNLIGIKQTSKPILVNMICCYTFSLHWIKVHGRNPVFICFIFKIPPKHTKIDIRSEILQNPQDIAKIKGKSRFEPKINAHFRLAAP